jgi:hypothetical protein
MATYACFTFYTGPKILGAWIDKSRPWPWQANRTSAGIADDAKNTEMNFCSQRVPDIRTLNCTLQEKPPSLFPCIWPQSRLFSEL